jgi:hypothetical protein
LRAISLFAGYALSGCQNTFLKPVLSQSTPGDDAVEVSMMTATTTSTASPTQTFTPPAPPTLIPKGPPPTRIPVVCQDDLEFVLDLSLPPGSDASLPVFSPGSRIEKGWRVRNSGTCTWDSAYLFVPEVDDPDWALVSQPVSIMGVVKPGDINDLWIEFTAPLTPGTYRAEWALQDSQGVAFGLPLTVGFEIAALPTETAQPRVSLIASELEIMPGEDAIISWSTIQSKAAYFYPYGRTWREHPVEVNGSTLVTPDKTTTYELRAVMGDGSIEIRRITIEVLPFDPPKILSFKFEPANIIDLGQCVDLHWRIDGRVNTVRVFRDGSFFVESLDEVGSSWDCPASSGFYIYTLQVSGPGGIVDTERRLEVR